MLELDSPRWATLRHAYGEASDIPTLLVQLEEVTHKQIIQPETNPIVDTEPWDSLWSALCHQGDVYTASYAALPHIVRIGRRATQDHWQFFALFAAIEVGHLAGHGPDMPADMEGDHALALQDVQDFVHDFADRKCDELLSQSMAAVLVVSKGHDILAEALLNMSPENARAFLVQQGVREETDEY